MKKKYEETSIYSKIYWLIQDQKITSGVIFDFLNFFWPNFICKSKYVFIESKFKDSSFKELVEVGVNPEYWINLITVDDFFSDEIFFEESMCLVESLSEILSTKLEKDFPALKFTVEYFGNEDEGDCGLTFYQSEIRSILKGNPPFPIIKENKIELFDDCSRPGKPELRMPRSDEIPEK